MMQKEVTLAFKNAFEGEMTAPKATAKIGGEEGMLAPYDMLFGALASCLYATFLDVGKKKRIGFEKVTMTVTGEKRETVPTTLKWVNVSVTVENAEKQKGLEQAMQLATEYCSIYQTVGHVAEMSYDISFV